MTRVRGKVLLSEHYEEKVLLHWLHFIQCFMGSIKCKNWTNFTKSSYYLALNIWVNNITLYSATTGWDQLLLEIILCESQQS